MGSGGVLVGDTAPDWSSAPVRQPHGTQPQHQRHRLAYPVTNPMASALAPRLARKGPTIARATS